MDKTAKMSLYRQGDVLVIPIRRRPRGAWEEVPREGDSVVLAHGEVTGHRHRLTDPGVCLLRSEGVSDRVLTVTSELAELVHEEHGTIEIPPGEYLVRIQREYSEIANRQVQD